MNRAGDLAKKKLKKQSEDFEKKRQEISKLFNTDSGIKILKLLRKSCNFDNVSTVLSQHGEINTNATIYNEGRRSIYIELRKYLNNDLRANAEKEGDN